MVLLVAARLLPAGEAGWALGVAFALIVAAGWLILPGLLIAAERAAAVFLGRSRELLRGQLTRQTRRTRATAACVAACLGPFAFAHAWGRSMLVPYLPATRLPDVIVSVLPTGLTPEAEARAGELPGLRPGRPPVGMAVEQTYLGPAAMGRPGMVGSTGSVLVMAVDPPQAFGGPDPPLPLRFRDADQAAVVAALATEPDACFASAVLMDRAGLRPGDRIDVLPPRDPDRSVTLVVRAAADLPGWQWMSKFTNMRNAGEDDVLPPIFVSRATAARLFGMTAARFFCCDVAGGEARGGAAATNMAAEGDAAVAELRAGFERLAAQSLAASAGDAGPTKAKVDRPFVRVADMRGVLSAVRVYAGQVIWLLSAVPLAALLVSMLGVAGAVLTGLRARRHEFGVLRSLGLTRPGLWRVLLAEAAGVTTAAAVAGVSLGLLAAEAAVAVSLTAGDLTGGAGLVVPWPALALGTALATAAVATATCAAAWAVVREEPAELVRRPG